jgi:hypothetical protein
MNDTNPEAGVAWSVEDAVSHMMESQAETTPDDETEAPQEADDDAEGHEPEVDEAEADEADADDADAEDAEPAEDDDAEPETFTVRVNGQDVQVNRDELLKGYQREADYRQKTQTLAEERRQIEAKNAEIKQIEAKLIERLQQLGGGDEQEPDWARLAQELDPWDFQKAFGDYMQTRRQRVAARQEFEQRQQAALQEHLKGEFAKLTEKVPEWRDQTAFKAALTELREGAGQHYGLPPEEVDGIKDHRAMLVLRDALSWRKMQSAKPVSEKRVSKPAKTAKPGAPKPRAQQASDNVRKLEDRLRRTGSTDAAVELLMARRGT